MTSRFSHVPPSARLLLGVTAAGAVAYAVMLIGAGGEGIVTDGTYPAMIFAVPRAAGG